MAKTKMGLLKIIGRSSQKEPKKDAPPQHWSHALPTSPMQSSSPFINRPPPLDPLVEAELRRSCAAVLQNLKPSGHDVEDTRMRSDMMLDENDRDGDSYSLPTNFQLTAEPAKPKRSNHSSAAWVIDKEDNKSNSRLSSLVNPNNIFKAPESAKAVNKDISAASAVNKSQRLSSLTSKQPLAPAIQPVTQVAVPESPAAPVSSPLPAPTGSSFSTATSTQPSSSTDQHASASTSASSAPFTPSKSSKRISRNSDLDPLGRPAGRMTALEAILRSPQVDTSSYPTSSPTQSKPGTAESTAARVAAAPVVAASAAATASTQKRPTSSQYSTRSEDNKSPGRATTPTSAAFGSANASKLTNIVEHRANQNETFRPSSKDGLRQSPTSPMGLNQGDSIPPVPKLTEERLNSLGGGSKAPSFQPTSNGDLPSPRLLGDQSKRLRDDKLADLRDKSDEPLATRRARLAAGLLPGSSLSATGNSALDSTLAVNSANTDISAEPSPLPRFPISHASSDEVQNVPAGVQGRANSLATHSHDPSVTIRDFYQPPPRSESRLSQTIKSTSAQDSGSAQASTNRDSVTSSSANQTTTGVTSRSASMLNRPHPAQVVREESEGTDNVSSAPITVYNASRSPPIMSPISPTSNTSGEPVTNGVTERPTTAPTSATNGISHMSQPSLSRPSQSQSISSQVRHSESGSRRPPSSRSRGEKRGLSKLFWKLGGGDMPARRKIYIPPELHSSRQRDADYWSDDDEACAAPVIGFGRGW